MAKREATVRLTQALFEQLEAATEHLDVGKSMIVDAALERFLNPTLSVEVLPTLTRADSWDFRCKLLISNPV